VIDLVLSGLVGQDAIGPVDLILDTDRDVPHGFGMAGRQIAATSVVRTSPGVSCGSGTSGGELVSAAEYRLTSKSDTVRSAQNNLRMTVSLRCGDNCTRIG
jgi:hypothetical protein